MLRTEVVEWTVLLCSMLIADSEEVSQAVVEELRRLTSKGGSPGKKSNHVEEIHDTSFSSAHRLRMTMNKTTSKSTISQ